MARRTFLHIGLGFIAGVVVTLAVVVASVVGFPGGAPSVDASTIWFDTVKRGDFVRQVRGAGTLEHTEDGELAAFLRIPESQSFDLAVGQAATIDLRARDVEGRVAGLGDVFESGTLRVLIEFTEELPEAARPGLSIDGTVEIETIPDVLYVGKPAYSRANSTVGLFKIVRNGRDEAVRVSVQFGPSSVNLIVVESGLEEGDEVLLSDMSRWDAVDQIRLR